MAVRERAEIGIRARGEFSNACAARRAPAEAKRRVGPRIGKRCGRIFSALERFGFSGVRFPLTLAPLPLS